MSLANVTVAGAIRLSTQGDWGQEPQQTGERKPQTVRGVHQRHFLRD